MPLELQYVLASTFSAHLNTTFQLNAARRVGHVGRIGPGQPPPPPATRPADRPTVDVFAGNAAAIVIYSACGFRVQERRGPLLHMVRVA